MTTDSLITFVRLMKEKEEGTNEGYKEINPRDVYFFNKHSKK